jgi:hypothetical protein
MSRRRNWDYPNPYLASDCAPPPRTGGGDTRLRVRGWGRPNSDGWRKSLALFLLYGLNSAVLGGGGGEGYIGKSGSMIDPS